MDIVLVDLDGVLADFDRALSDEIAIHYPEIKFVRQQSYFINDDLKSQELKRMVRKVKTRPGFFKDLPVIDNAIEGVHRIISLGYHPVICSSPLDSNPTCKEDKLSWIEQYLAPHVSFPIVDEAHITSNKYRCSGLALIDDRPEIRNSEKANWTQVVFDQVYNKKAKASYRLNGWLDPNLKDILSDIRSKIAT